MNDKIILKKKCGVCKSAYYQDENKKFYCRHKKEEIINLNSVCDDFEYGKLFKRFNRKFKNFHLEE